MSQRYRRLGLLAVALVLLIPGWNGRVERRQQRPRNLVLITLDTMRADRLPAYGFTAVETPALDRLAAEGVVFEETFAAVPLTVPSHATLFTGLYPPRLGVRDNTNAPLAARFETLAEVLRDRGLTTAAFVASAVLDSSRGLDQGFSLYDDDLSSSCSGAVHARRPASQVVDHALAWFARTGSEPFFVWIHLYDTHRPYDLPSEYARLYSDPYSAAIAFQDAQIGRIVNHLERRNLAKDTLVIVAGDHGESLGDHGEETHGLFLYQEALHVPFIINGPGVSPHRVRAVTRLVDVMPTVLALFGVARHSLDGVSLANVVNGARSATALELDVYAESNYPQRLGWAPLRSLRSGRYKVIDAPRAELYDLSLDPREQRDLFAERRSVGTALLDRLQGVDAAFPPVTGSSAKLDREAAARISALGYVGGSVEREGTVAAPLADPKDRVAEFNRITASRSSRRAQCLGKP